MVEPSEESQKVATLSQNDELKVLEIKGEWYRIRSGSTIGYVKKEATTYRNYVQEETEKNSSNINTSTSQKSKAELLSTLSFGMALNKPSGLTLEQFKTILSDSKDKNKIFEQNAEYFYYIEKEYNINGVFVAAVGIHESNWGTSKIAQEKYNLFGYGAYDSNPYNGAYTFSDYSECIDEAKRDQRLEIRPELKEFPNSLKEYDVIFLGFPNFWGTMPMAMFTLLENINLNDKIIKPFCSHEGSGLGRSIEDIRRLCPDSIVKEGFAIHGKNFIEEDLKNWINK